MRLKALILGLMTALLLNAPVNVEASVYQAENSISFTTTDVAVGVTAEHLQLRNHYIVKRDLVFQCVKEYVKPCFEKRGLALSNYEYEAVAFAALQLENAQHTVKGEEYGFSAKGVIYEEWVLAGIYGNKKYMQAYIELKKQMQAINDTYQAAFFFYFDNKNSPRIDEKTLQLVRERNSKLSNIYLTLENMELYWQPGHYLMLTGDDVNFRSAPSINSEVIDSLRLNEKLYPVTGETLIVEGRKWVQAINAKGQDGYVSADYVQLVD